MSQIRVTPKPGVPASYEMLRALNLPPEGAVVEDSVFWRRRAADGDVDLVEVVTAPPPVSGGKSK